MRNLRNYAFEFLSIFVAVISAFALNNWNDNRLRREAENKILFEIYKGLEGDLEDVRINIEGHRAGVGSVNFFRNLIAGNAVAIDSFPYHYFKFTRDFISIQNISGYETLKSKGLEIIRDDLLRSKIISIYEYDYTILKKLEEEYSELQFFSTYFKEVTEIIGQDLIINENNSIGGISSPLSISQKDAKILLSYLWKIESNRKFILGFYDDVERKIESLRADIEPFL